MRPLGLGTQAPYSYFSSSWMTSKKVYFHLFGPICSWAMIRAQKSSS